MNIEYMAFDELKKLYPDEWILLGNPEMKDTFILGGTVLFHSKDKKEVYYIGRKKTDDLDTVTIAFAGDLKSHRKIGILKKAMKIFKFSLPTDEDVIIVNASLERKYKFRLAFDTAATHTNY